MKNKIQLILFITLLLTGLQGKFATVAANPVVDFTSSGSCVGSPTVFRVNDIITNVGKVADWLWNFGDGKFSNIQNPSHTYDGAGTYHVRLWIKDTLGDTVSIVHDVTIQDLPVPIFSYNTPNCNNDSIQFTNLSTTSNGHITSVLWDFKDGSPTETYLIPGNPNPKHAFPNTGTFGVTLTVINNYLCENTDTIDVTITARPVADFNFSGKCEDQEVTFKDASIANSGGGIIERTWDFRDPVSGIDNTSDKVSPSHIFQNAGTYLVKLTIKNYNNCVDTVSKNVVINPHPAVAILTTAACLSKKITFSPDPVITNIPSIAKWLWDFGDGYSANTKNPSHTFTVPNNYSVALKVTDSMGCINVVSYPVVVDPLPVAHFNATLANCAGTSVHFVNQNQPATSTGYVVQWNWNFGDGDSVTVNQLGKPDISHVYAVPGIYKSYLRLVTSNGCFNSDSLKITILPNPKADFIYVATSSGTVVNFTDITDINGSGFITSRNWDFGDAGSGILNKALIANPEHIFTTAGNHTVTLTVTTSNGCTNTVIKTVAIIPQPIAGFTYSQAACKKRLVQFTNLSTVLAPGFIVRSEWDFGDGYTQTVPGVASVSYVYSSSTTYSVKLTVTTNDSCKKTFNLPVTLLPEPLSDFAFLSTCHNSPVQFTDLSKPVSGAITSRLWNFGDALSGSNNVASSQAPSHTYHAAGTFQVSLIVANTAGCVDTIVKQLKVHVLPTVDFAFSAGCVNNSTQFVSSPFVNAATMVAYNWNFGDGLTSSEDNPSHKYSSSGSFITTLTVTDTSGCSNTKTSTVAILAPPVSSFQVSPQSCAKNPVLFTDNSSTANGTLTSFFLEFGDGKDTLINAAAIGTISHTFTKGGKYTAYLTVKNSLGCMAKSSHSFITSPNPQAKFSYGNTCEAETVSFNDLSLTNSGTTIVNMFWNFGDSSSGTDNLSNQKNPFHVYATPGIYTVLLTVENASGCSDKISAIIDIKPKPVVDFSWDAACLGSKTTFTMNSSIMNLATVASFEWDFGDGTVHNTTQKNPVHSYAVSSDFTVTLIITNTNGCKNRISHTVRILPKPTALFSLTNVCAGATTEFSEQSILSGALPIASWHWDFGVPAAINDTSDQKDPAWIYSAKGVYTVKLTVTSQNGCRDMASRSVQVFGNPTADFGYTASACENGLVNFRNTSLSQQATIVTSNWEFEPDNYSPVQNPSYTYYSIDSCYDVRLIVKDIRGCIDTTVKQVCVPAKFGFTFAESATCVKDSTYFTPQLLTHLGGPLVTFKWNFGDESTGVNNTSTKKIPSHYYSQTGSYTVSLEATDINNCKDIYYKNITINPLPVASFTYTKGICDSTIYFNESSFGNGSAISRWIWDFGDGVVSTFDTAGSPHVSHLYRSPGSYNVSLTVVNANGCSNSIVENNILVNPCVDAAIELIDTKICQKNVVTFRNNSFSSVTSNIWYWDFGDGTHATYDMFSNQVNHVYKTPGAFMVQLILSAYVNGRKVNDTAHLVVNVNPSPFPDFTFSVVCNEKKVQFTNMTSGSGIKIDTYKWTFGESVSAPQNTSALKNPDHSYLAPGTYEVTLKAQNVIGCKDSIQKLLVINGPPIANFKSQLSCAGNKTLFSDLSTNADVPITAWNWTFKDNMGIVGGKETQNPEFVFKKSGDYTVLLKITDANGCHDSIIQNIYSWDVPVSDFKLVENFDNVQGQVQLNNTSANASQYHWTFGNGNDSYAEKPVELYPYEGEYKITLIAYSKKGCSDTLSIPYEFMVKSLYVPTAFSPLNPRKEVQLLKPVGINLQSYLFEIFDRWGSLLWWTDKLDSEGRPTEGWDGKFKDKLLPEGAYPWRASGIFKDGSIWQGENVGNNDHLPSSKVGTSTMMR